MPVTNENLIDFVCTGYSLIPLVGSSTGPAVAFFLKEAFGMNQSQSAPDMMISFISEYSLNDAKGQVKALKANANSLLDALNNWQKTQTSEAAQEVRSRNGYAISEARSLLEVLSSPIESQKAAVQIPMVTCAFMYLTMLADTIQNGDDWGYEPDLLKSYEAEMYRYADKVFEYVAWNYAKSGYEYNPKRWPKCGDIDFDRYNASADAMQRSLIYFTSQYNNITVNPDRRKTVIVRSPTDEEAVIIPNRNILVYPNYFEMHSQKAFYPTIPEHRNGLDKESGTYTIKIQGPNIKVKLRALIAGSSQGGALSSTLTLFTDTNPELLPASDMRKWTLLKTLHQSSISSNIESLIYVELDHILDLEEASEMSMTLKATCMTLYLYHLEIIPVDECN